MTEPHPHCVHECVCSFYKARMGELSFEPCDLNMKDVCPHSSTISAEQVLSLIDKIIAWHKTLHWKESEDEPNITISMLIKKVAELRSERER